MHVHYIEYTVVTTASDENVSHANYMEDLYHQNLCLKNTKNTHFGGGENILRDCAYNRQKI